MKTMKQDNYEDHLDLDFKDIAANFLYTNRREFLKLTGGIVVFFTVGGPLAIAQEGRRRGQGLHWLCKVTRGPLVCLGYPACR